MKMLRFGVAVALIAFTVAVLAQAASADPTHAKGSLTITAICDGQQVLISGNGNGVFTPGHVIGDTTMIIPTAFDLTFTFTPPDGPTKSEANTSAKHNQAKGTVTCDIPLALNTFTSPEGTFTLSGTVTGFFTPANGK